MIYGITVERNLTFDDSFSALMSTMHSESVELFFDFCQQSILFILFDIWAGICWTFGVKFLAILPKLHSNLQRIIFKRNELVQNHSFSYVLALGKENILTGDILGSTLLTWLQFLILEHSLDTFSQQFWIFLMWFDIWEWSSFMFSSKFLAQFSEM